MLVLDIVAFLILSVVGAHLYYLGGEGRKLLRTIGMPVITMAICFIFTHSLVHWWVYLLVGALTYANMTSYCKFGKQDDVFWYNWLLTGLVSGIVLLPMAIVTHHLTGLLIRVALTVLGTTLISELSSKVKIEAYGRGGVFLLTLPLMLV